MHDILFNKYVYFQNAERYVGSLGIMANVIHCSHAEKVDGTGG